jgi:deoxyribonucleoside regulator
MSDRDPQGPKGSKRSKSGGTRRGGAAKSSASGTTREGSADGAAPHRTWRDIGNDVAVQVAVVKTKYRHNGVPSLLSHGEVARILKLSVRAVEAAHEGAFKAELFDVTPRIPQGSISLTSLADEVRRRYNLRDVIVVAANDAFLRPSDDPEVRRARHTEVVRNMLPSLAAYVDKYLREDKTRRRMGVAWGGIMELYAEHLTYSERRLFLPDLEVVPIIGITSMASTRGVEANIVAMNVARAYRGVSAQLPCPAFVKRLVESDAVKQQEYVKKMLAKIANCSVVVTSMGAIRPDEPVSEMKLANDPTMNERLVSQAQLAGACGDVCYWLFDAEGREVQTEYESIGLGFEGLRRIARDPARRVVLVTGGDKRRFAPLKIALRAGLASVLVTDNVTAAHLVDKV